MENAKTVRRPAIEKEFISFIREQERKFSPEDTLKIDLHCHDFNSDTPDVQMARLMNLPETWLKTGDLVSSLRANGCDAITITNHNNAGPVLIFWTRERMY